MNYIVVDGQYYIFFREKIDEKSLCVKEIKGKNALKYINFI